MSTDVTEIQRVALVHDFLLDVRGAERVFEELCEIWPQGDIFTAVYDEKGTEGRFAHRNVHSSFLQRLRPSARNFRTLLPLYPAAIESLDLPGYDLVISSSSAWAHAVRCGERAVHRELLPQPVPLRLERARRDPRRARPGLPGGAARSVRSLAALGPRGRAAADPLRRQLGRHAAADRRVLRPRLRDRASAGRRRPVLAVARRGRRALRDRLRADVPQADRRRDRGLQPPASAHW